VAVVETWVSTEPWNRTVTGTKQLRSCNKSLSLHVQPLPPLASSLGASIVGTLLRVLFSLLLSLALGKSFAFLGSLFPQLVLQSLFKSLAQSSLSSSLSPLLVEVDLGSPELFGVSCNITLNPNFLSLVSFFLRKEDLVIDCPLSLPPTSAIIFSIPTFEFEVVVLLLKCS
jgi:hypothetical protein